MPFYCVQSKASAGPMRTYWIDAKSVDQARTLVALNVASAANARDAALFDCMPDDTKRPPPGLIYSDSEGPTKITRT
jgi:hypothetical protein